MSGTGGETGGETGDRAAVDHRLSTARRVLTYGLALLFGPLVLLVSWTAITRARSLPRLERAEFEAARQLWSQSGPTDYNVEVVVQGRQPATYRVEVRGGEVRTALRNGLPLTQPRTMGTWSVPGMFGTIETDLENIERAGQTGSQAGGTRLMLRCRFDSRYGYPARFHRTELVRYGDNPEVSWEVTLFENLSEVSAGHSIIRLPAPLARRPILSPVSLPMSLYPAMGPGFPGDA